MTDKRGPGVKLSDAQVVDVRERYAAGARQVDLAETFGVSQNTVSALVLGRTRLAAGGPLKPGSGSEAAQKKANSPTPRKATGGKPPLTTEQVDAIRDRVAAGESRAAVAAALGVSIHTVHSIMSGRRKGRNRTPERQFSDEDVSRMRTLFAEGVSQSDLAEQFGTQQQAVSQIVRGTMYATFGGPLSAENSD